MKLPNRQSALIRCEQKEIENKFIWWMSVEITRQFIGLVLFEGDESLYSNKCQQAILETFNFKVQRKNGDYRRLKAKT